MGQSLTLVAFCMCHHHHCIYTHLHPIPSQYTGKGPKPHVSSDTFLLPLLPPLPLSKKTPRRRREEQARVVSIPKAVVPNHLVLFSLFHHLPFKGRFPQPPGNVLGVHRALLKRIYCRTWWHSRYVCMCVGGTPCMYTQAVCDFCMCIYLGRLP